MADFNKLRTLLASRSGAPQPSFARSEEDVAMAKASNANESLPDFVKRRQDDLLKQIVAEQGGNPEQASEAADLAMNVGSISGGITDISRKELAAILSKLTNQGRAVNEADLVRSLELQTGYENLGKNKRALHRVLGHLDLEQAGLPEHQYVEAVRGNYPEIQEIPLFRHADSDVINKRLLAEVPEIYHPKNRTVYTPNDTGSFMSLPNRRGSNELPIAIGLTENSDKLINAGVLGHEGQHLRDIVKNPNFKSAEVFKEMAPNFSSKEELLAHINKITPEQSLNQVSQGHHAKDYPNSYEFKRVIEHLNRNLPVENTADLIQKTKEQYGKFLNLRKSLQ